jgi:CheY-like chemotaxis protein
MGGNLHVTSEPGVGSTFSFELEFETLDADDSISKHAEAAMIEKPSFDGLVLVCEDNPMNQQVICEHLERVGLQAEVAENGFIAVKMVEDRMRNGLKPYDLIFMDIFMPVMDGMEAASKITAMETGTPIVAMTANIIASEIENYKKNGMSECVGKPFTTQQLWRCLLKNLASAKVGDEVGAQALSDDTLQEKLKLSFVRNNQNKYPEIAEALTAGDMKHAHRLVHSLKSNAGFLGKTELQKTAAEIESILKDEGIPSAEKMSTLESELKSVLEELKPLMDEHADKERQESAEKRPEPAERNLPDTEQAKALFAKLEPMLKSRNSESLALLGDIRSIPGAEELARQIEKYNFKLAAQTLAELKKRMDVTNG